ncbi:hypothetical protein GE061_014205 [Apolygus lucorum]|uniref:Apple domain-containing protein n=1 Tax=Apolygus lucorum TaxID=248454 RepID=A0A8S9XS07_APOLU|nr:hypothetical protein GE061_014205 [Apolygus lucorum]
MMSYNAFTTTLLALAYLNCACAQTEYGVPDSNTESSTFPVRFVPECAEGSWLTFVRVAGFQPRQPVHPQLLYSSTYGSSITAECYNRCREAEDCTGYVLEYATASCYKIQMTPTTVLTFIESPGVSYFFKTCLTLPNNCSDKAWCAELVPGYTLNAEPSAVVDANDRIECMEACISQENEGAPCKSANFNAERRTCTLSTYNRWTHPAAFSEASQSYEYVENMCASEMNSAVCWRPPLVNKTSLRADLQLFNVTEKTCKGRCSEEVYFRCRAYSYLGVPQECLLHADAALSEYPGPPLNPQLEPAQDAAYVEMVPCNNPSDNYTRPNITVECDKEHMNVTLYRKSFGGRMSVSGRANECTAWGKDNDVTQLIIPLPNGENVCNVQEKLAIGQVNRTWATVKVIVQRHKLIEQAGDFAVIVNCFLTEGESPPSVYNIPLSTGYVVNELPFDTEISGEWGNEYGNATEPRARMLLLDTKTGEQVSEVTVGRAVTLRVIIDPPYNTSHVRVHHLTARSGDGRDSLWLLDADGCPPNPKIFPGLIPTSEYTLDGNFLSFRFTPSSVLNIFGNLTVYTTPVEPIKCQGSAARRKRSTQAVEEVPLQLSIVVHSQATNETASPILQASFGGETSIERRGEDMLCMTFLTASLVALFFLLLQSALLTICCVLLRRAGKDRPGDTISLRQDFDLPPRQVTFSDEVLAFPHRDLRLSTPMKT